MRCQLDDFSYFCEERLISLPFWRFELQRTFLLRPELSRVASGGPIPRFQLAIYAAFRSCSNNAVAAAKASAN